MVANLHSEELIPGLTLSPGISRIYSEEVERADGNEYMLPPNPWEPGQISEFIDWLRSKGPLSITGLPRYLDAVYWERTDLQETMPEVQDGELEAFAHWVEVYGRSES